MRFQISRQTLIAALIPSIIVWWALFIYLYDLQNIINLRNSIKNNPLLSRLDPVINESVERISGGNFYFSRPLDILFIKSKLYSSSLPKLTLSIKPSDLSKLNSNVQQALSEGTYLIDKYNIWVPAVFTTSSGTFAAEVKYRGDRYSHWTGNKRSIKIRHFSETDSTQSTTINLITPDERGYLSAHLSKYVAKKLELMHQQDSFVTLEFNGQDMGIYYLTRPIDENFLNEANKPLGNIYSDVYGNVSWSPNMDVFKRLTDWKKIVNHPNEQLTDTNDLQALLSWINTQTSEGQESPATIINTNEFIRWQAHSVISGNFTQNNDHNMKLYFNPHSKQVEPIVDDIRVFPDSLSLLDICDSFDIVYNDLVDILLSNQDLLEKRNKIILDYLHEPTFASDDLTYTNELINSMSLEFKKGNRRSTQLQLSYYLYSFPKKLSTWYDALRAKLREADIGISVEQNNSNIGFTVELTSPGGINIDSAEIIDSEDNITSQLIINEHVAPKLGVSKTNRICKNYQSQSRQYLFNCSDCTGSKIRLHTSTSLTSESSIIEQQI